MSRHEHHRRSALKGMTCTLCLQSGDHTQESGASRLQEYLSSARHNRRGRHEVVDDLANELNQYVFPFPSNPSDDQGIGAPHSSGGQLSVSSSLATSPTLHPPHLGYDRTILSGHEAFVPLPSFNSPFADLNSEDGSSGSSADVTQAWLDNHAEHPSRQRAIRSLLDMSHQNVNNLPTTLFITGVEVYKSDDEDEAKPVAGGSFADVYVGNYQGQDVAIKRLRIFQSNDDTNRLYKRFYREALIWRQLRHPHILPFLGVDLDALTGRGTLSMVSPWMTKGTLMEYLKQAGSSHSIDHHKLIADIALGLDYLHSEFVVHGDLHGSNIFINEHRRALLGDFGFTALAEISNVSPTTSSNKIGAARWLSPELLNHDIGRTPRPTKSSDIFAFGRICLSVYTRRVPFHEIRSDVGVLVKVLQNQHPPRPTKETCHGEEIPDHLWELISRCWATDMRQRPHVRDVLLSINEISF